MAKGRLLNNGHTVVMISGVDFDGYITCHHTREERNRFIFRVVDDDKLNPEECPLCKRSLKPTIQLGAFQKSHHFSEYESSYIGG